jgi:uncharacterized membrane protein YidH (DUF202 family)
MWKKKKKGKKRKRKNKRRGVMSLTEIVLIFAVVFAIAAILLHKIGIRIDREAYIALFFVIFVIVLIVEGLHDFSQQARIHHMREAQYRTCQKAGNSDDECKKIVYLNKK